jgi:hypothetical protein
MRAFHMAKDSSLNSPYILKLWTRQPSSWRVPKVTSISVR